MERKCNNVPFLVLMQTSKAIHDRIKEEMANIKLGITEFSVLEVLYQKGKQTIQQIGNCILISSGTMTYVIDKLEQKGLLSRNACPDDRRVIHVTLTVEGNELMNEIMPKYHEFVNDMFEGLNSNEAETLVKLLNKVRNNV
ncbi:MarR family transcriptional regulator [Neobacillus sedimentimangrovi]|jgi:MarR family transcriptional regulator, 2-MHQ and catechol-resistance regulon repressor|uniref:MarR family transcriptional regulator n=1 Tax=Neobacillus sedimentimangrovi TaxID=2699460 RepID=A0ABS8QDQ4_9BACI|nr:MarR family transcriptional regulator [Neobacillus sedimentimangrovi]AIM17754.1 MarR family transcriptional regulator [Bacillus sp. X1(2014)]MCD4837405.1 MarR family transcriptional regulator [Neobacillus sedimentimangrovi]